MTEETKTEFVVLGHVELADDKIGMRVVPLASYKGPDSEENSTLFIADNSIIGAVYEANVKIEDGKINSMPKRGGIFCRLLSDDFDAAKTKAQALANRAKAKRAEKRIKADKGAMLEIERLAEIVKNSGRARYEVVNVISGMILDRSYGRGK